MKTAVTSSHYIERHSWTNRRYWRTSTHPKTFRIWFKKQTWQVNRHRNSK